MLLSTLLSPLLASFGLAAAAVAPAQPPAAPQGSLSLGQLPQDAQLAQLVWEHNPDVLQARARLVGDRAEAQRAHLLPNPTFDLGLNTIPIGATNPPELKDPLLNVPNVGFTLSELFEIGKRGPRQRAAASAADATREEVRELVRQHYFDLVERIGEVAVSEARIAELEDLVEDAARLTDTESKRVSKGDAADLDADRARLEEEKLRSSLGAEREALQVNLIECSRAAGLPCEPFGDAQKASAFLDRRLAALGQGAAERQQIEERPDLVALRLREQSAEASRSLAHAKVIPDPTVRVGYVRDQFVVSGNQQNSLFVGVNLPLPAFDRGQVDARQAEAQIEAARGTREVLLRQAERDSVRLNENAKALLARRTQLRERTIPLARGVVDRLQKAVVAGGAVLQDLLLARRTLGELVLDAADLDSAGFKASVGLARTTGETPPLPESGSHDEKR